MTRNEAIAKLPNERWYGEEAQKGYLLDCLQVLGLIKFDEEPLYASPSMIIRDELVTLCQLPMQKAEKVVNSLYQAGYIITRRVDHPK